MRQRVIHRVLQPAPRRVPQWSSRLRHRQPLSPAAECRRASHWALPERLWSATGPRAGEQRRLRRGRTRPWKRAGWQLSGRDAVFQRGSGRPPADGALSWRALVAVARSGCALGRATRRLSSRWKRTGGRRTGSASTTGRASPQAAGCAPPASPSGPFCSSSRYVLLTRRHAGASGPNPVPRVASESCRRCNRPPRLRSSSDGPTPTLPACAAAATAAISVRWSSATGSSRCTCSPSARSSSGCTCQTGTAWSGSGQG